MCAASTGSARRRSTSGRRKFGGLEVSEARRLRTLEAENARLKKLLAAAMLDQRDAERRGWERMVTSPPRGERPWCTCREQRAVSERRACRVLGADRTAVRYRSIRPDDAATTGPAAGPGGRASAVRVSSSGAAAVAGGPGAEPQEAASAVCRGALAGAPSWRSQACAWARARRSRCRMARTSGGPLDFVSDSLSDGASDRCAVRGRRLHSGVLGLSGGQRRCRGCGWAREPDAIVALRGLPLTMVATTGRS